MSKRLTRLVPGSGVDTEVFVPRDVPEPKPLRVVLISRMLYDKGIFHFVEAARLLQGTAPDARFVLVGPVDEENPAAVPSGELMRWVDGGYVKWDGVAQDILKVYRDASVVVLPSRREGMPKVVLEAAACGLPVVSTDVPGCRDSVVHGQTGYLVPWGDSQALADRIGELLHNETLRQEMGRNARCFVEERFAASIVTKQIMDIALELV